jgi:YidC/Oxa1 family membrane protein insertase
MTTLWSTWVDLIASLLAVLSGPAGLGTGLAIVALTLLLRTLILPITWQNSYRGYIRQRKLALLQPELKRLKERYARDPQKYSAALAALYREHGMSMVDGRALVGGLAQMPLLLGVFNALRRGTAHGRFLWVKDLAQPDLAFAIVAGVTTALLTLAAPDLPEHVRMLMLIVPAVCLTLTAMHLASGLALYWATSNVFGAAQTVALRTVIARRIAAGDLKL